MQNLSHAKENTITRIGTMTCACVYTIWFLDKPISLSRTTNETEHYKMWVCDPASTSGPVVIVIVIVVVDFSFSFGLNF